MTKLIIAIPSMIWMDLIGSLEPLQAIEFSWLVNQARFVSHLSNFLHFQCLLTDQVIVSLDSIILIATFLAILAAI